MPDPLQPNAPTGMIGGMASTELSSANTNLAFERTRMAADRTLMAIVRTSLSLIGFGFTLYKVFSELTSKGGLGDSDHAARRLGAALLALGLILLVLGIGAHLRVQRELTRRRKRLFDMGLVHSQTEYRSTPTFVVALLLLLVGLVALASIVSRALMVGRV
jgi:putative membrane protein